MEIGHRCLGGKGRGWQWHLRARMKQLSDIIWRNSTERSPLVNWSELGQRYQIKNTNGDLAKNGGQIAFEWLKSEGVNVGRFKKRRRENDAGNVRKRLKRGAGGEITVPCPETNKSVQEKLKQKVLSGDISVGELIVPRKVTIAH